MKTLILAIAVLTLLAFSFNDAIFRAAHTVKNENSMYNSFSDSSEVDSLEDETPTSPLKDVSNMFNERGFYKSNGFSFDEQEIINDFNGNLMYSIPLYSYKLGGDLDLSIKLNYNGSVGHTTIVGNPTSISTGITSRYNMNFPEWIIDVNGIAVQVYNFETNFFDSSGQIVIGDQKLIQGSNLNMLVNGYHFDNDLQSTLDNNDRINILAGDGSIISLENTNNNYDASDTSNYVGTYIYKGKETYYKAIVSYLPSPTNGNAGYNPRKIILLKGDGLEYVFEETQISFSDMNSSTVVDPQLKPLSIYLKEIRDRFDHSIKFSYAAGHPGRAVLSMIKCSGISSTINGPGFIVNFGQNHCRIEHESELNGNYIFYFDRPVDYENHPNKNQRGNINKIVNILNQITEIGYQTYKRRLTGVQNPFEHTANMTLSLNDLRRIIFVKNNLDLKRKYQYFALDSMDIYLQSFFANPENNIMTSNSTYYKGYGRDPFFTNMLSNKKDSTNILRSVTSYNYAYALFDDRENLLTKPIDSGDIYESTTEILYSNKPSWDSTPSYVKTWRQYRIYPLYDPNDHFAYNPDSDASTKLLIEDFLNTVDASIKKIEYKYDLGTFDMLNKGFNGSFLIKTKKEIYPGLTNVKSWSYNYTFKDGNPDKPPIETKLTDPLKNYLIRKDSVFYGGYWHKMFNSDFIYNSALIYSYYYRINQPISESRYDQLNNQLFKKTYEYINEDTSSSLGYYKQLKSDKIYSSPGFSSYIETQYEYCKNDTSGRYIFAETGIFPYKEGNIKVIRINDQETKYFYNPISLSEVYKNTVSGTDEPPGIPKLKYKIKYNNGAEENTFENIWDYRFPIRTDKYKINGGSRDTLSITYKTYTLDGSPSKIIDQNKYLTRFIYQPIHRINSITLPGDFSTIPDSVKSIIHYNYYDDTVLVRSNGWGYYNYLNNFSFSTENAELLGNSFNSSCPYLMMDVNFVISQYTSKKAAFFKFSNSEVISNFDSIDFANLKIGIRGYSHPSSDFYTSLLPVTSINSQQLYECSSGINFDKNSISMDDPQDINITPNSLNSFDVKDLLENLNSHNIPLKGMAIFGGLEDFPDPASFNFSMTFHNINNRPDAVYWQSTNAPVLTIAGKLNISDTLREPIIHGGTIRYFYDDENHSIKVYSVRDGVLDERSKIKYSTDEFGNVKQKDIFTSDTDSNSYKYYFNYLNQPSENIDGFGNVTKFSYDGLRRLVKTKNVDSSSTINYYSYTDDFDTYFGKVDGITEIQSFYDEEGNNFKKCFDGVGNLVREIKYVADVGNINGGLPIPLNTDYLYDSLYRVVQVRTPNGKDIYYAYDGYGRQSKRITPDAGQTDFIYDKNSTLIYSQDAVQRAVDFAKYTFRNYDGFNRLTGIGDDIFSNDYPSDGTQNVPSTPTNYLTINVYDTISNSIVDIFDGVNDSGHFYTKGQLAATAYRTQKFDPWNFKYYKYDVRGRVIKMWNIISGFDTLITQYYYNSQDQVTYLWYRPSKSDAQLYYYTYDYAGGLKDLYYYTGQIPDNPYDSIYTDSPGDFANFVTYEYNENSQISTQGFDGNSFFNSYYYNNRNWIKEMDASDHSLHYENSYFKNGNVKEQALSGNYNDNFAKTDDLEFTYFYDMSNRLITSITEEHSVYELENTYDKDGNLLTLSRNDSSGSHLEDFDYTYYSGTNKLKRVTGSQTQFRYDNNGNMIKDSLNSNYNILYDYRNLITQLSQRVIAESGITFDTTYYNAYYNYDEAGNRIRKKVYKFIGTTSIPSQQDDPLREDSLTDMPSHWQLVNDEIYSRGVNGKELCIYKNGEVEQWNVWGADNVGKLVISEERIKPLFYMKDHLGSVRAIVDDKENVLSAQDYDAWGHLLQGRTYEGDESKFKFTSKERDKESGYDYFGARYYDARIGRWGSIEPYYDNYLNISPYNYSINNPINMIDVEGRDVNVGSIRLADESNKTNNLEKLIKGLEELTGFKITVENDLLIYDDSEINGGSEEARYWFKKAVDYEQTLNVFSIENVTSYGRGLEMNLNPDMINSFVKGAKGGVNPNTMGWGTSFIHELFHTEIGGNLRDKHGWGVIGPVEKIVNKVRSQMGKDWGQRVSYDPKERGNIDYYPLSDITKNQLDRNELPSHFRVEY